MEGGTLSVPLPPRLVPLPSGRGCRQSRQVRALDAAPKSPHQSASLTASPRGRSPRGREKPTGEGEAQMPSSDLAALGQLLPRQKKLAPCSSPSGRGCRQSRQVRADALIRPRCARPASPRGKIPPAGEMSAEQTKGGRRSPDAVEKPESPHQSRLRRDSFSQREKPMRGGSPRGGHPSFSEYARFQHSLIFGIFGGQSSSPQRRAHLTALSQPFSRARRRSSSMAGVKIRSTAQFCRTSSSPDQ